MDFDFGKIKLPSDKDRPVDPIKIFRSLAVTDTNINDLWLGQGDALREWNNHRDEDDVAVVLNTGAGKTLVGLLIAQSLVNETRRQVVYACSNIQLIEQTARMSKGYGLTLATYHSGKFSQQELYFRAEAPCVTTYQALFNGKSRLASHDISAVILDDAHTAEHILRDQFSLHITRAEMPDTYESIVALFQPYYKAIGVSSSYAELRAGKSKRQFLIPPFEMRSNSENLRHLLLNANLSVSINTKFSWEHIRDHEDLCCLLISDGNVTITPPVIPTSKLSYFRKGCRRVYLSATLAAPDSFVRSFGHKPGKFVTPSTTAGECERMILIPSAVPDVDDDVESAKKLIENDKALILVPSFARAEKWADIAPYPRRETAPEVIESFRNSNGTDKITLAARYDGIDLPGDSCRVMILDGLPTGIGPLESFLWERLNMQNSYRSLVATRIVQSFGRISRGMTDHGVVILTSKQLVEWLQIPRNLSLLPEFLQKQIELGESISYQATDVNGLREAAESCLTSKPDWKQFYSDYMNNPVSANSSYDHKEALKIAMAEAEFGTALWDRDFVRASKELNKILDEAFTFSQYTGAWLSLWLGFTLEMQGKVKDAHYYYNKAYSAGSDIPRLPPSVKHSIAPIPEQVRKITQQMRIGLENSISIEPPKHLEHNLHALNGKASHRQTEEALRSLGEYLGLTSTRPDKEFGSGPDVLWIGENGYAMCMEVKTGKEKTSIYKKDDVGQLHNHIQWVNDNHKVADIIPIFVGPILPASNNASPSPAMKVVELQQFCNLGKQLVEVLRYVSKKAMPISLENELNSAIEERGLLYPAVIQSLDTHSL